MNYTTLALFITPLVTAAGGYLIARRKNSGKIDTSDAATLWKEAGNIRQALRDEVVDLRIKLEKTELQLSQALAQLDKMKVRIDILEEHDEKQ